MVAAVLLLAMSCNIVHLAGVLIGETFISARYAMRKKSRKSPSLLPPPRFVNLAVPSWAYGQQALVGNDMIIPSKLIRAALVCVAKNDPRYYLCGIHITPKYIESTNGRVALRMEHGIRTKRDIIVQFEGKMPAKAETTELIFNKEPLAIHRDQYLNRLAITGIKLIDGRFPDLGKIIPKKFNLSANPVIQAEYLGYPTKMFSCEGNFIPMQIWPSGEFDAVKIKFNKQIDTAYGNPQFIVMPCRDDYFKVKEQES